MKYFKFSIAMTLVACASDLPRDRKVKTAIPVENVDLSQIAFTDAVNEESINLAQYMADNDLEYLLLMFGSLKCAKCNEKALNLSKNYIPKHELFLEKQEKRFDIVGINTDTGTTQSAFRAIMLSEDERNARGYDFVKWIDPRGEKMMSYLAEKGDRFGVPFTVLLNRKGILWRFNNKTIYTVEELVNRVVATLNGDATGGGGSGDSEEGGDDHIPNPRDFPLLSFETPYRFDRVNVKTCAGTPATLRNSLTSTDYLLLQVGKDDCENGSVCARNLDHLRAAKNVCAASGKRCDVIHLSKNQMRAPTCSQSDIRMLVGGQDVFDAFQTHFNWRYEPNVDSWGAPTSLPAVEGPLVFVFRSDGLLVHSWEGLLPDAAAENALENVVATPMNTRSVGINHTVFGDTGARSPSSASFGALRQSAKYTVTAAFDRYCGSCMEELSYWSLSSQVRSYCSKSNGFCQVFALESELPNSDSTQGRLDLYNEIKNDFFADNNVSVPLLIEQTQFGDGYGRIFESYLTPMYPNWEGVYGSVIYDREGKVIAQFKSAGAHSNDPVLSALKALKNLP